MFILLFIDLNNLLLNPKKPEYKGLIILFVIEELIQQELNFLSDIPLRKFSKHNKLINGNKPATKQIKFLDLFKVVQMFGNNL
jgi:hypothetical protein